MKFSHRWWVIVGLLFAFAATVSFLAAQTEEPSSVNAPSSAEVQSDSVEAQPSSDEPEQRQPTLVPDRDMAVDVETARLYNEFRSKFLDERAKKIDERAEMINWWLIVIGIVITFFGIAIPIITYNRLNKLEESEKEARRYVEDIKTIRDEVEIDREVSEAISLQQQNRPDEAIEKWRSIANTTEETDGRAAEAWFNIGYLLSPNNVRGEDFEGAIVAYTRAIELNLRGPNLYWAYYNRGNAKTSLGQTEAAIADFDAAIRLNPNYAEAYNNRGVAKRHLGQHEAAITDYDAAIRLDSTYVAAYNNRGIARMNLGQHEAAIADFDAAIRLDSTYVAAYNNRGIARMNLGQYEAAIADYDTAILLNPNYAEAYCNRGIAKGHLGQHEAAIADFDAAIRLYPDYTDAYFRRGNAKAQLDRIDEARQDFEMALNLARAAGNADLMAQAERALEDLDKGDAP